MCHTAVPDRRALSATMRCDLTLSPQIILVLQPKCGVEDLGEASAADIGPKGVPFMTALFEEDGDL